MLELTFEDRLYRHSLWDEVAPVVSGEVSWEAAMDPHLLQPQVGTFEFFRRRVSI